MSERDREQSLAGRRALVTGGASGIGRATVKRLAAEGAAVVVDYVGEADPADVLVGEVERDGGRAIAIEADVSDEEQVDAMFARARDELGPVDLLVNNAGAERPFALVDMPLEEWNETIARELAPRGIRVVNVAPGAILTPINQGLIDDPGKRRAVEAEIPWGRLGQPEEVAAAIAWLAGPQAEYVTGSTLFVDGGMTLYPNFV